MKVNEFLKEEFDSEEYNDEVGMVRTNLHTIARMCEVLDRHLADDENMAEWAQEKVAIVKSMIVTVTDYVISQHEQGIQPTVNEEASAGATGAGSITTVVNPHVAHSKKKPKMQKPTDNALDMKGTSLFGGPMVKR